MFNISGYLEKFRKIGEKSDRIKRAAVDSFKEESGVDIDPASVKISSGEISVSVPPPLHPIVFMKRERIIAALKKRLPEISIERIRCR